MIRPHSEIAARARRFSAFASLRSDSTLLSLPDTQEGAVSHQDKPARASPLPACLVGRSVGVRVRVHHARVRE
eukprot:6547405-Prymnesium_polylepis.1